MTDTLPQDLFSRLKFDDHGLIAAVIQDAENDEVLMVGYMNDVALARTLSTGRVWFWSRSRQEYWRKGDTSGHIQLVRKVELDCDGDCVLVHAIQVGAACHTGTRTCFEAGGELEAVVIDQKLSESHALAQEVES
ncbi:phosphoribosyl-AMP cyclohydrolase [Changpingibacter yushuensis]|uniref:phosphoribosyl-AMP cyclohydrolase n=1 Tax=Changpingibacter yushuensis TaxID=2758440 RepID=UPI00165D843A|nr:phosphoribosyl-AMP cyclohydrolase [Changpingibacter yushuensis]